METLVMLLSTSFSACTFLSSKDLKISSYFLQYIPVNFGFENSILNVCLFSSPFPVHVVMMLEGETYFFVTLGRERVKC